MVSPNAVRYVGYVGAAANWLIPIAAMSNLYYQPADSINPSMTAVLTAYSCIFFRWSIAISPPNYPLMACHIVNASAQAATGVKYAFAHKGQAAEPIASTGKQAGITNKE